MDVHGIVMDDHDGIMDIRSYCELWMSIIIMDINNLINDVHISAVYVSVAALLVTCLKISWFIHKHMGIHN